MNRLRIEPYDVELEMADLGRYSLVRVFVDDRLEASKAEPFAAGDDSIILDQCLCCGMCGMPEIEVRRLEDEVLWFRVDSEPLRDLGPSWAEVRIFARDEYEAALGKDSTENLPEVSGKDVLAFVNEQRFPDWHDGLYTIPDIEEDPQGRVALRELRESLQADGDELFVVPAATTTLRLRIGLELPGTPEAVYEIGDDDGRLAVKLVALPTCPVWITGPALAKWAAKILSVARPDELA